VEMFGVVTSVIDMNDGSKNNQKEWHERQIEKNTYTLLKKLFVGLRTYSEHIQKNKICSNE